MKFLKSAAAGLLALCLTVGVLFGATAPVGAAEFTDETEIMEGLFAILRAEFEITVNSENYDSVYAESRPVEYEKTDEPAYLALGGNTAIGYGANGYGTDSNSGYASKLAEHLGLSDSFENKATTALSAASAVEYIAEHAESVRKADFITLQIDGSTIITAISGSADSSISLKDYVTDDEFDNTIADFRDRIEDEYISNVLECILYECIVYSVETVRAVEAICELNPNATVLVIGLYNPLRGLTITQTGKKTVNVNNFVDEMILFCNSFLLSKTLNINKVAFVDVADTPTPGFGDKALASGDTVAYSYLLDQIRSDISAQHANQAGHDFILAEIKASYKNACEHPDQTWTEVSAPSCMEKGVEACVCTICGKNATRKIEKLPHDLDEGEVIKAASCSEEGEKYHECLAEGCDYTTVLPIEKLPHTPGDYTKNNDANCKSKGTVSANCTVCEALITVQDPDGELGDHEYGEDNVCIHCNEKRVSVAAVVAVSSGAAVAAGGAGYGVWFFRKRKIPGINLPEAEIDLPVDDVVSEIEPEISVDEVTEAPTETAETAAEVTDEQ